MTKVCNTLYYINILVIYCNIFFTLQLDDYLALFYIIFGSIPFTCYNS